ncbi:hypothetical protein ZWY2020_001152 [Hordeum vulgare]|nr:hypothetical protein ZWY2020_001152 [Hordeum vulgare]
MEIDGFTLIVRDLHEAHQGDLRISKVSTDLISKSPRFGGRFWVLADQESDDEVEEINYEEFDRSTAVADVDHLEPGTIRRVRAQARGPKKKVSKHKVRPWIGPLPMVKLAPIMLSDFFPEAGWCLAKGRKKNNLACPKLTASAMTKPSSTPPEMRFQREVFLKSASEAAGVVLDSIKDNFIGYMAQEESPGMDKSKPDSVSPRYMAQAIPTSTADIPVRSAGLGDLHQGSSIACTGAPEPRVPRRQQRGFPSLGSGRAARVPPPPSVTSMAGRGTSRPPPTAQPRPSGQGDRPPPPIAKQPAAAQMARPPGATQAGRQPGPPDQRGAGISNAAAVGRDGNTYGEGQYRGSSSYGGGRGHAAMNNGPNQPFTAPPGNFVPGTSGPSHHKRWGFRQNWAGKGGGRKPRPTMPAQEPPADDVVRATIPEKVAADPVIPEHAPAVAKGEGDAKLVSNPPGIMQSDMEADPERCVSAVEDAPARELGAGEVLTPALGAAPAPVGASLGNMGAPAPVQSPIVATAMMEDGACMGGDPHEHEVSCMAVRVDHAADIRMAADACSTAAADRQVQGVAHACTVVPAPDFGGELGAALEDANNGEASLATDGVLTETTEDYITDEYRRTKIAQQHVQSNNKPSRKKGYKKEDSTSEATASLKPFINRVINDIKEICKEIIRLPELCAQRMIEELNKTGVGYKPGNLEEEKENAYGENNKRKGISL